MSDVQKLPDYQYTIFDDWKKEMKSLKNFI